jgi:hypothetical protein
MRKIFLFIIILTLAGCETEKIIFNGPYHVRFSHATGTEKESNSDIILIEVHNVGPVLSEGITASYSVGGDAREGIDYQILGTRGKVVIPEDEYFGYIEVELINNANNILRSQDIVFTLTNVNTKNFEVGQGEGGLGKTFTLTILDDCILGGSYAGRPGLSGPLTHDINITSSDPECEDYVISNWDVGIFEAADPMPLNFIDHGDNTLTVPSQDQEVFFGFFSYDIVVEGIGSVDPVTKEIFLSLSFVYEGDTYPVTLTFIPE